MNKEIKEFLVESNAIEGVYDDVSLEQATEAWEFMMEQDVLSSSVILKMHKILMLHQDLRPNEKGYFRKVDVFIGGKKAINPILVDESVDLLVMNMNDIVQNGKKESEIFLERITKDHHVIYEMIHPFVDGNGRTGRMIMNWQRLKVGLPILIIHEGEEQMEYYKWFK